MGTLSHNPEKSTTGHGRWRAGMRLAALVLLLSVGAGCTSARKRDSPSSMPGYLLKQDTETQARLGRIYRTGTLYQDFRTVLLVDAIAMNLEYRRGYVAMLRKSYMLSDADADDILRAEDADFDGTLSFLVFLYGGSNVPILLGQPTSQWRVFLQDDDGQTLTPLRIERLRPENPNYRYLRVVFASPNDLGAYGLDRWSQAFRIAFPKLDKAALRQPVGAHPIELVVTGVDGTVRLSWQDAHDFYRAPAAPPPAAPAESKPLPAK